MKDFCVYFLFLSQRNYNLFLCKTTRGVLNQNLHNLFPSQCKSFDSFLGGEGGENFDVGGQKFSWRKTKISRGAHKYCAELNGYLSTFERDFV